LARPVLSTRLCKELGIEYPILSAGMGPSLIGEATGATVELAVAVSEAGGCGVLGAAGYSVDEMRDAIRETKKLTDKPFGVDILLPSANVQHGDAESRPPTQVMDLLEKALPKEYYEWFLKVKAEHNLPDLKIEMKNDSTTNRPHESVEVILEEKVPLFCAGLGNPGFMVERAHKIGMKVLGLTGNTRNVRRVANSGADYVVAQGHEAGGHTGRIGTMAFLPQAIDAAGDVPVLAAGGIGDGRGVAASLAMGCAGVWVGTRFLATKESGLVDEQGQYIVNASDEDTRRSHLYTGKTSRTIHSRVHDLWEESGLEFLPFGQQGLLSTALIGSFNAAKKFEYVGPFGGQVAGLIDEIKPAGQIVEEMVAEAVDILGRKIPAMIDVKA
jgi:nitronate monooxygenase